MPKLHHYHFHLTAAVVPLHESAAYRSLTQPLPSLGQEEAEEGGEASLLLLSEESAIADLEREIQSSGLPPSPADEGATDQTPDVTDDVSCDTSPSPSAPVAAPVEQRYVPSPLHPLLITSLRCAFLQVSGVQHFCSETTTGYVRVPYVDCRRK